MSFTRRSTRPRPPTTNGSSSARRLAGLLWTSSPISSTSASGSTATIPTGRRPLRGKHPQPALAAPELDADHDGPRQVGVSLVRRLGSRLSVRRVGPGRRRIRQASTLAPALRAVSAPQRPDSGLRVGVLRPQSARPRLGGLAGLQHGPDSLGQGRPRVSRALFPQAADQLRLVDEQG